MSLEMARAASKRLAFREQIPGYVPIAATVQDHGQEFKKYDKSLSRITITERNLETYVTDRPQSMTIDRKTNLIIKQTLKG